MIIILEGPDGAGKSTLACQLQADLHYIRGPIPVIHAGKPQGKEEILRGAQLDIARAKEHKLYILDRTRWISEPVYSKALERPCLIDPDKLPECWNTPLQLVIYLTADTYNIVDGKAHKSPLYMSQILSKHSKVVEGYEEFFSQPLPFKVLHFNRHQDSYSGLLHDIVQGLDL